MLGLSSSPSRLHLLMLLISELEFHDYLGPDLPVAHDEPFTGSVSSSERELSTITLDRSSYPFRDVIKFFAAVPNNHSNHRIRQTQEEWMAVNCETVSDVG